MTVRASRFDECGHFGPDRVRLGALMIPSFDQTLGVGRDRIPRCPVRIERRVRVALIGERRVRPGGLRILAEVQHVVVMRMPAHAHAHQLDERRAKAGAGALDRPGECRGDLVGIRAVDRDAGDAVAGGLVGEHTDG